MIATTSVRVSRLRSRDSDAEAAGLASRPNAFGRLAELFTEVIMTGQMTLATCTISVSGAALLTVLLAQSGVTQQRAAETIG